MSKGPDHSQKPAPVVGQQSGQSYTPITHHAPKESKTANGEQRVIVSSEATLTHQTLQNSRNTEEGAKADKQTRGQSKGTGLDTGHRHSTSHNTDPADKQNTYLQNSAQNRAGGTKRLVETQRDDTLRRDAAKSVHERSDLIYAPGRPGYSMEKPIAEKVTHTSSKDGKVVGQNTVYFGNFSSSASRYAEAQRGAGKQVDSAVVRQLNAKDRANARSQGHGTATQALANAEKLRRSPDPTEPVAVVDKRAAAKRMLQQSHSSPAKGPSLVPARTPKP